MARVPTIAEEDAKHAMILLDDATPEPGWDFRKVQRVKWTKFSEATASHSLIFNGAWLKAARETLKWLIENEATIKQRLAP